MALFRVFLCFLWLKILLIFAGKWCRIIVYRDFNFRCLFASGRNECFNGASGEANGLRKVKLL